MDNKQQVGAPDKDRINVNEDYELNYWAKKWGVTTSEIRQAVDKVGTSVRNVQIYLNK